jgi:hypothetical protein
MNDTPACRDGKFTDALEDDGHALHPRTEFAYPAEFSEEELARELSTAVAMLRPRAGLGVQRTALLEQLQRVFQALSHLFGAEGQGSDGPSLKDILDFIWCAGADGLAQASADAALMRCGVVSWYLQPALFGDANQKEFGILLREQAEMRCPNCTARLKEIEGTLRRPSPAFRLREYRGQWMDEKFLRAELKSITPKFLTSEMKKQSPNRIVTEFRDRFGVVNGHMRSERAREVFREREKRKKEEQC